jgi:hypothetical protein
VGFLAQIVTGMQGRLVPLYAWYRAFAAKGSPPERSANSLPHAPFAKAIFLLWTPALPLLAAGLPSESQFAIRLAALLLLGGVTAGGAYILYMLRQSRQPWRVADDQFVAPPSGGRSSL